MLPNYQKYRDFVQVLSELYSYATESQLDVAGLRQRLAAVQQFFSQQIIPLADDEGRVQSYRTEMSKQLRLLEMDVLFLQGARQAATAQARVEAIGNRIQTLIQYCNAILGSGG